MTIDDVIIANDPPQGNSEPHGIIYKIRQSVTNENILSYVVPTAHEIYAGNANSLVKWDDFCTTKTTKGSYIEIEFKDRFVFPSFYSFKAHASSGTYCTPKEWTVYGLVSSSASPEIIATNTTEGSTSCYPYVNSCDCSNDNWGTFAIHDAKKAYRYFRIESKVPVQSGNYRVKMRAFEIFGILSKDGRVTRPKKTICYASYHVARHIPLHAALRL